MLQNKWISVRKSLTTIFVLLFLASSAYSATQNHISKSSTVFNQNIQQAVNRAYLKYRLPALSVSISLPGESNIRNYTAGTYTLASKRNITPHSLFQIGSITKTYVAVLIMKLVKEGKLSLNDKLGTLLPKYRKWSDITVDELLHHTSGVYKYIDAKNFWLNFKKHPYKQWSLSQLADLAYQYPNNFKPGKSYLYTNTDYVILGLIIEKVTKQTAASALDSYLLNSKQDKLKDTYYAAEGYPSGTMQNIAHGYGNSGQVVCISISSYITGCTVSRYGSTHSIRYHQMFRKFCTIHLSH